MRPGCGGTEVSFFSWVTAGCTARFSTRVGVAITAGAAAAAGALALTSAVWKNARWAALRASLAVGEFACGCSGRPVIGVRAKV